ncbi:MAG: hypothetical protein M3162_09625 [Thermoproteota archaeon]|nr:hypothetical protein [Thermoproteota archaeon]
MIIPRDLEVAVSMQARAESEKHARITHGQSEIQVIKKFLDASNLYPYNPVAYALRQTHLFYETIKSMEIQYNNYYSARNS